MTSAGLNDVQTMQMDGILEVREATSIWLNKQIFVCIFFFYILTSKGVPPSHLMSSLDINSDKEQGKKI